MSYPHSPFPKTFDHEIIKKLPNNENNSTVSEECYESTLRWLCTPPRISSYRVNSLRSTTTDLTSTINKNFQNYFSIINTLQENQQTEKYIPSIQTHPTIPNLIIINNITIRGDALQKFDKEIIIDVDCACAVLRGANIFAPGILGMSAGTKLDERVSIYADLGGKCKRGQQKLHDGEEKLFIANGIIKFQRYQLFGDDLKPSGNGVIVTERISGCPTLSEDIVPAESALLQNIPSILCVLALDPLPGQTVIDLCASPGNKTTHIAELMKNQGILIALDKTPKKVEILKNKCDLFGATNVHIFQADSTKIVESDKCVADNLLCGPPFPEEFFDRILLDAPCSVLGKRPQLANRMKEKEIRSFVPLQRKLMEAAVRLLKPNGILVYSTCTITLSENEGIIAWTLKKFKNMTLRTPKIALGGSGWPGTSLTDIELKKVQRFGPESEIDSVGFFFCVLTKIPLESSDIVQMNDFLNREY